MTCTHGRRGCCWLCSDLRPFWREARIKAGLGEEPPNAVKPPEPVPVTPRADPDAWDELGLYEREVMKWLGNTGREGLDGLMLYPRHEAALKKLQTKGYAGVDPNNGLWYLGQRGSAVLASRKGA